MISLLAALILASPAAGYVVVGSDAVLLKPARLLAGPNIVWLGASPDGRYGLAVQNDLPDADLTSLAKVLPIGDRPDLKRLLALDLEAGTALPIFTWSGRLSEIQIAWSSEPGKAFLLHSRPLSPSEDPVNGRFSHRVTLLDLVRRKTEPEFALDSRLIGPYPQLTASPTRPGALLVGQKIRFAESGAIVDEQFVFQAVLASGRPGESVEFARNSSGPQASSWINEGSQWGFLVSKSGAKSGYIFDPTSMALSEAPFLTLPEAASKPLRLTARSMGDEVDSIKTVWLEAEAPSERMKALLAANVSHFALAGNLKGALYVQSGALFYRPFQKVNLSQLKSALIAADREEAASVARDFARALLLYWRDSELTFPSRREALLPYVVNQEYLSRLTYTFPGGRLAQGQSPSRVRAGWISAEFGKMWLNLDGSMEWEFLPPTR